MNIEAKHEKQKAHHNVKDGRDNNTFQTTPSRAPPYPWHKQESPDEKLDTAQNGEDIHMASQGSNRFQISDLITIHIKSYRRRT